MEKAKDFILRQFKDSDTQEELKEHNLPGIDWIERTQQTIDWVLPNLICLAPKLVEALEKKYNSFNVIYAKYKDNTEDKEYLDNALDLLDSVTSNHVSEQVQKFLSENMDPKLYMNGANSYPDLFLEKHDYTSLPQGRKGLPEGMKEGPYLSRYRQFPLRPNKAPDGIEIKATRQHPLSIMAHAPHLGLHFAVKWSFSDHKFKINDVMLSYMARHRYRIPVRTTEAETVKVFLEEKHFISLLRDAPAS